MSGAVVDAAIGWLGILTIVDLVVVVRARSALDRVLGIDILALLAIALLLLFSYRERTPYYTDAAIVLALVSFIGTLRIARHIADRGRPR